jgi:hypothetical protein
MFIPPRRFFVLGLLALGAILGPAARKAAGTSPEAIKPQDSCAYDDYVAHPPPSDKEGRANVTLMVVAGTPRLPGKPPDNPGVETSTYVRLGEEVTVCIRNLHDWIWAQDDKKNTLSSLRLSIGGHILSSAAPSSIGPSEQEYLNFIPRLDPANSDDWKAWAEIVYAARHQGKDKRVGRLAMTVALVDSKEFFETTAYPRIGTGGDSWYWILGLFILLIGTLLYLAAATDMLRYVVGAKPQGGKRPPFSLGLVQMAFWFCLALGAYVYIVMVTRQVHVPMYSVLGLLGISATTGLAAVFVDKQKTSSSPEAQAAAVASPASSQGLWADILSDGDGVSFHRFQITVWTIVLGVVFVWSVYRDITMPEFDASLLTLMGISSGTYIGFKFPEKLKTADTPAPTQPPPVPGAPAPATGN